MVQHSSEPKRGQQLSAPTQSDGAMACTGRSGKAKPSRRYRQIRGYTCHQPRTIREFQDSRLSETAMLSAGSCPRSAAPGWNPAASHPRKGKTLKSPPIGRFSEFSRRAEKSRPSSHGDTSDCASQATSSIIGGAVSTRAGFPNAVPLRSWITWQARSSSGRCADEGNARLRASTSARAGLRPSIQAAKTRSAISTNFSGLIDRFLASLRYVRRECSFLYMGHAS